MDSSSPLSKMQLHYWEAKQTFLKKVKRKEDDCVVASDAELDAKLELLKSIDETNQNLLNLLDLYQDRVCGVAQEECIIGRFMRECSKVDQTRAGKLMSDSGKTLLFASHQFIQLRNVLIRIYRDVQTFQYRAVADTFDTVERMEKSRTAYRAALLWMKDISKQLDPDVYNQMDKFKKVQNHVRKTKKTFEKLKIDSIQKIDLLSASRCNLFSNVLANYQNTLQSIWSKSSKTMNIFVDIFKSPQNYEFTMLKELNNQTVDQQFESFEAKLKSILEQENISEKDMLLFFESDYTDECHPRETDPNKSKSSHDKSNQYMNRITSNSKARYARKTINDQAVVEEAKGNQIEGNSSLLDLNFTSQIDQSVNNELSNVQLMANFTATNSFMPSSLIDLHHLNRMDIINSRDDSVSLQQPVSDLSASKPPTKVSNETNTLQSWLNMFADIDPLANPSELDKLSSDQRFDRNC